MKIDGKCHCGFISFEAEVDPAGASLCHCADCQTLSGSPYRVSVAAPRETFRMLGGEPTLYVKVAESGRKRAQAFCPKCGSPIYATSADDPNAPVNIRAGIVRQRDALVPRRQIWVRSAQKWAGDLTALPQAETQ